MLTLSSTNTSYSSPVTAQYTLLCISLFIKAKSISLLILFLHRFCYYLQKFVWFYQSGHWQSANIVSIYHLLIGWLTVKTVVTVKTVFVSLPYSMRNCTICLFYHHSSLAFGSIAILFCSFIIIRFVKIVFLVICKILSSYLLIMLSNILSCVVGAW